MTDRLALQAIHNLQEMNIIPFKKGDSVRVPDPTEDDTWNHEFIGTVTRIWMDKRIGDITPVDIADITDQEDCAFSIETSRLHPDAPLCICFSCEHRCFKDKECYCTFDSFSEYVYDKCCSCRDEDSAEDCEPIGSCDAFKTVTVRVQNDNSKTDTILRDELILLARKMQVIVEKRYGIKAPRLNSLIIATILSYLKREGFHK